MTKKVIKILEIMHPAGDWYTVYVDGKRTTQGHSIDVQTTKATMEQMGFQVDYDYLELPEHLADKYDGDYLPDNLEDLGL